jgi:hypothetical protein
MSDLQSVLSSIQQKLNAPKNQYNSFGKYNYRNCEDILMALKPLLGKCILIINDEMVAIGDRVYVKATATISLGVESISASAFAREALTKKGMDDSQVTGATSSYARKYALNGLLLIDDNKDADSHRPVESPVNNSSKNSVNLSALQSHIESNGYTAQQICEFYQVQSLNNLTDIQAVINQINEWVKG